MKEKMLYMSHVDWNWIKQRPHFLAEGLMEHFDVSVLYMFQNRNRKNLQKRSAEGQDITPVYSIPLAGRLKPLGILNRAFLKAQFTRQVRRVRPKYVYLTYPPQVDHLPKDYSGIVIYDCMDDHAAMTLSSRKEAMQDQERRLLCRADVVLVTSENLRRVLLERYGQALAPKMRLVRNGYSGEILPAEPKNSCTGADFTLSYIGTIGQWFNFDYILRSLAEIPNLRYKIIGPSDRELPQSDRIEYTGTMEHHKLYDAVKDTDCLMMPFVVNDIVASVDPVKLYEYINYNMNILCVHYPEIERFRPFVHFYEDYDTFLARIREMMADNTIRYDNALRQRFLQENNWSGRVESIVSILREDG